MKRLIIVILILVFNIYYVNSYLNEYVQGKVSDLFYDCSSGESCRCQATFFMTLNSTSLLVQPVSTGSTDYDYINQEYKSIVSQGTLTTIYVEMWNRPGYNTYPILSVSNMESDAIDVTVPWICQEQHFQFKLTPIQRLGFLYVVGVSTINSTMDISPAYGSSPGFALVAYIARTYLNEVNLCVLPLKNQTSVLSYNDPLTLPITTPLVSTNYTIPNITPFVNLTFISAIHYPTVQVYVEYGQSGQINSFINVQGYNKPAIVFSEFGSVFPMLGNSQDMQLVSADKFNYQGITNPIVSQTFYNIRGPTLTPILPSPKSFDLYFQDPQTFFTNSTPIDLGPTLGTLNLVMGDYFNPVKLYYQSNVEYTIPYPYGYKHNYDEQLNLIRYSFSFLTGVFNFKATILFRQTTQLFDETINFYLQDTLVPILVSVDFQPFSSDSFIVTMRITDNFSGVYKIEFGTSPVRRFYASDTLISGNELDGIYVFEYSYSSIDTSPHLINIYDNNQNVLQIEKDIYDINLTKIPPRPFNPILQITSDDFTHFEFYPNIVNTSLGPSMVTMLFNLTENFPRDTLVKFSFGWNSHMLYYTDLMMPVIAEYHPPDNMFRADFLIPANTENYTLTFAKTSFSPIDAIQASLIEKFGSQAKVDLVSNYLDIKPPMVTRLVPIPGNNIMNSGADFLVGFNITIVDRPNGFREGTWNIKSSIDGKLYSFKLDNSTRVSGDQFEGTYQVNWTMDGSYCQNQTFSTYNISLVDQSGATSEYPSLMNFEPAVHLDPFIQLITSPLNLFINYNCSVPTTSDSVPPTILAFSFTQDNDARVVNFDLTIQDALVGISLRHNPVVYIWDKNGRYVSIESNNRIIHNVSTVSYQYSTQLTYSVASTPSLVSVYGLVDKNLNTDGYSSADLKSNGFQYDITVPQSPDVPVLFESTSVYRIGGILTVRGAKLGDSTLPNLVAFIDYGNGEEMAPIDMVYNVGLHVKVGTIPSTTTKLILRVRSNVPSQQYSNKLVIQVKEYKPTRVIPPNPEPIPCPGSPLVCSGRGQCTNDGCVCVAPWFGPACTSQVVPVNPPIRNETDPTVIIGGGNGTSGGNGTGGNQPIKVRTIISIVAIRELSYDGVEVAMHKFSNWTLTDQSNSTQDNIHNSTQLYNYQTLMNQNSTLVNVNIEWFNQSTTIQFAQSNITLPPFSTKISMSLSRYDFASILNTLQVIFKVTFQDDEGIDRCVEKGYGLGNDDNQDDVQWLKIQIEDQMLYGQFIRRALVDGRPNNVRNVVLDGLFGDTLSTDSFIGINIPHYSFSATIDPNFSNLINFDGETPSCGDTNKLSNGAIAGIVVGCVIALAIVIGTIILIKKKHTQKGYEIQMKKKLDSFNKSQ
ncbi:hypothetical protein DFA_00059 [Cavenderia fasciculata]|uniref:EGF-like domain-containing protein n=1 Tax=Cavenderia fasciculata TaxID=261658 RepID=F4PXH2_CACFS|nr:uncharacterized protein DFA_00059 [Cavenderia fasciculata]EGG19482.1 hypothetical protein DFA_00059 [Cavenderia fasciculata]|eukprot:XP_004357776.1 hypothetical protein DFA_00059 [Cavenderia fasciculata]